MDESRLFNTLQPILELEIVSGNSIESIEAPLGTNCQFLVNLKNKINHQSANQLLLKNIVDKLQKGANRHPVN